MMDGSLRRAAVEGSVRRVRAYARRANSEDSIEVLSTTESIFPDDLTAITEEEAEQQPLSNSFDNEEETLTESESVHNEEKKVNGTIQKDEGCVDGEESIKQTSVSGGSMIREAFERLKKNQVQKDSSPKKTSRQGKTAPTAVLSKGPTKHVLPQHPHHRFRMMFALPNVCSCVSDVEKLRSLCKTTMWILRSHIT